jgi:two-component system chemotaxis response regulator CheB
MKVLIADDSIVIRNIIKEILTAQRDIQVVGEVSNGQLALAAALELKPDIVIMDMDMPVMNGLEATCRITRSSAIPVLMFTNNTDPELPFRALERGAADFLRKPDFSDINRPEYISKFVNTLHDISARYKGRIFYSQKQHMTECAVSLQEPSKPLAATAMPKPSHESNRHVHGYDQSAQWNFAAMQRPELIVLGASTGGPQAVANFLTDLKQSLPVPLVIVQHIETGFDKGYADWLADESGLSVQLARDHERPEPGKVYVAPTDFHLLIERGRLKLDNGDKVLNQKPAVDVLFQSAAQFFGRRTLGILLTGMGSDGANGCVSIVKAGGTTLVQDEATSLIFGMPRAAAERGGATHVLPLPAISQFLLAALETLA